MRRRRSAPDSARAGAATVRRLCRQILAGEGVQRAEVSVVYGNDALLRDLNRRFRGLDRATDVLSFTYEDERGTGGRLVRGDVVISLERLAGQARRRRARWGDELVRLLVHGFLHLTGHDHKRVEERRRMQERERRHLETVTDGERRRLSRLVRQWTERLESRCRM
jgi:probable rRNA maturation factor